MEVFDEYLMAIFYGSFNRCETEIEKKKSHTGFFFLFLRAQCEQKSKFSPVKFTRYCKLFVCVSIIMQPT